MTLLRLCALIAVAAPGFAAVAAAPSLGRGAAAAAASSASPAPAPEARAATSDAPVPEPLIPPAGPPPGDAEVQSAIDRGLAYLALTQDRATGGWRQDVGYKFNDRYEVTVANRPHVGVTALALMAFIAGGHLPGRGKYGDVVERGTDFILSCVDPDEGYISANETRMYSHAFATLFLAEIYGMTRRADLRMKLQQAVDLTVNSQNRQGSWRYRPLAPDSDMSIAVCQLMALRAARNIGIAVPRSTITRAYKYIENSAYPRGSMNSGDFKYQIDQEQTRTSFALTAAGVASLLHAGYYDDVMVRDGVRSLKRKVVRLEWDERFPSYFYWYGHYYCSQVMFIAGDREPGLWESYYDRMSAELLQKQSADGSWRNDPGPGAVFGTAVATIILQIPYEFLPIFQR
ncbi:MAG: prenyltransferase/squalene oxidase repeat-containing protein [Planctomycetota bacterium]